MEEVLNTLLTNTWKKEYVGYRYALYRHIMKEEAERVVKDESIIMENPQYMHS